MIRYRRSAAHGTCEGANAKESVPQHIKLKINSYYPPMSSRIDFVTPRAGQSPRPTRNSIITELLEVLSANNVFTDWIRVYQMIYLGINSSHCFQRDLNLIFILFLGNLIAHFPPSSSCFWKPHPLY